MIMSACCRRPARKCADNARVENTCPPGQSLPVAGRDRDCDAGGMSGRHGQYIPRRQPVRRNASRIGRARAGMHDTPVRLLSERRHRHVRRAEQCTVSEAERIDQAGTRRGLSVRLVALQSQLHMIGGWVCGQPPSCPATLCGARWYVRAAATHERAGVDAAAEPSAAATPLGAVASRAHNALATATKATGAHHHEIGSGIAVADKPSTSFITRLCDRPPLRSPHKRLPVQG